MFETYEEAMARLEAKQKLIDAELEALMAEKSEADLAERFFRDFGCLNFISDEKQHEVELARAFHVWHKAKHPELHDEHEEEPYRCYHKTVCKCGFSTAVDSSD